MSDTEARLIEGAEAVFEHLNGNHADTVLFLASHVAGSVLIDAELVGADQTGVDLVVRDDAGDRAIRMPFAEPATSAADLQGQLIGALASARAALPDGPLTSIEREMAGRDAIPTRMVTAVAIQDVGEGIRQITFGGLRGHRMLGPDDFFLVIRPRPGQEQLLEGDVRFGELLDLPPEKQPDWAYYTCRRWRPEIGEMDVWFVLHEHDGPISGWARRARVGDRCALWGPRTGFEPPDGTERLLLVGDETAVGAVAATLEQSDPTMRIDVLLESDHGGPVIDLPEHPGAEVRWLARNGLERGTGTLLVDAVSALDLDPNDGLYAYGGGESRLVTAVRKHLRHERGIPGPQVQMIGYWRREG